MIKETKLNGFSAIPLEYEVVDGDLSTALGVVSEDGSLKPMLEPKVIMTFLKPSQKVVYIHEATAFHYYIVHDTETGGVYYVEKNQPGKQVLNLIHSFGKTKLYAFSAIGNILMVLTEQGVYHYLWKSKADGYWLSVHICLNALSPSDCKLRLCEQTSSVFRLMQSPHQIYSRSSPMKTKQR